MRNTTNRILYGLSVASILAWSPALRAEQAAPTSFATPAVTTAPVATAEAKPSVSAKFAAELYGFVEFDTIHDSTESFNDLAGNGIISRGNYAASHQRTIFSVRNSRLGFKLKGPDTEMLKTSAIIEMDFLGNQPSPVSEAGFVTSPTFRIRHFALKLDTPFVNILLGQYWQLFGWQSSFHPNTVELQGVPGQIYSRSPQIRLSHVFASQPVNVEVAVAAVRPAQRDSSIPDGQAGLKVVLNDWKGLHTSGSTGTAIDGASIGVSGVVRRFELPDPTAATSAKTKNGSGISVDALIPVIPATPESKGNSLTLTGSFVRGTGIADLYTGLSGGLGAPTPPTSGSGTSTYSANVDSGLLAFDSTTGELRTINWLSYMAGIQYYLPPSGRVWLSANFSSMKSTNLASFTTRSKVFDHSLWADGNLFVDVNKAVRLGAELAWFRQTYGDGVKVHNYRGQFSAFYIF
jgi:hypothetical protein